MKAMKQTTKQRQGSVDNRSMTADGSQSSTDCTLNSSLLGEKRAARMAETFGNEYDDLKASAYICSHSQPKFTFSSFGKQIKSSAADSISPNCCGQTADLTVSSSWSQAGVAPVTRHKRTLSDAVANCLVCFWPTMSSIEERPHNDCFITVDRYSGRLEQPDWHASDADTPVVRTDLNDNAFITTCLEQVDEHPAPTGFTPLSGEILSLPKRTISKPRHINPNTSIEDDIACQMKLGRLTPISLADQTRNGATMTSTLNTLHRRNDEISVGYFTAQTLDAILYSSPSKMNEPVGTPRNKDNRANLGGNNRSAFQTPGGNRARLDSEIFRRTIKVITCEKRKITDDSDVSPIDSDAGFSPMKGSNAKRPPLTDNCLLPPRQTPATVQKKLTFDLGSVQRHATPNLPRCPPNNTPGKRNLLQDFAAEPISEALSPLSEFGMSVMKSLQSIVKGKPTNVPAYVQTSSGYETDKENMPGNTPTSAMHVKTLSASSEREELWQDSFLQKSSSFLKALRRTGRRGKVLIQGWVAFRESMPWKEIIRNPKRCDFRYIVLLDDMPLLHIFSSRPKQKKLLPKYDLLQDCISVDLTGDNIAIKIGLVSKEFGNEVYIVDVEKNQYLHGLLPIPMPSDVFCDRHKSRLAKGDTLKSVFEPFKRSVSFAPSLPNDTKDKASDSPATMVQYDVSRHLLFVLDCAVKFPLNNPDRPSMLRLQ